MVKAPIWAAWLCCALGFVGAGLSKRPIRGAAIGAAFGLIPAAVIWLPDDLNHDGSSSIGMLVFFGNHGCCLFARGHPNDSRPIT